MDYSALQHWLEQLELSLDSSQKRMLMRILSQGLRVRMRDRIKRQRDPDGHRFIPRKRDQIGNKKRSGAMFQRLSKHIKTQYSDQYAAVGFADRTGKIARVHQDGLIAKPTRIARPTAYPQRKTVGFSDDDITWIEHTILDFMSTK